MRLDQVIVVLLSAVGVYSAPVTENLVERQTATTVAKLQAVALIGEYDLQTWCSEWLGDLTTAK